MITVVTRIFPITAVSKDFPNLLTPSDLGKPVEVHKYSLLDPRTGLKYIVETTFCIGRANALESSKKSGLTYLTESKTALNHTSVTNISEEYAFSVPKNISKDKVSQLFSPSKAKEIEKDIKEPGIKLHLNLKKIREATRQRSLIKKREKLVQPLLKYFISNECLICGAILNETNKNKIMTHMSLHIKLGTYACQGCENKCFSSPEALLSHSIKHLEKKKYNCDLCNKIFNRKHFLSVHYKKDHHEVIFEPQQLFNPGIIKKKVPTCFVCTICKVKLSSWKLLLEHKKAHVGKENYLCLFCNKTFPTSCLLRYHSHVRIISKRYSCKFCHKAFSSLNRLQQHKLMHKRKIHYKCKVCAKQFNFRNNLVEHIQLLHS